MTQISTYVPAGYMLADYLKKKAKGAVGMAGLVMDVNREQQANLASVQPKPTPSIAPQAPSQSPAIAPQSPRPGMGDRAMLDRGMPQAGSTPAVAAPKPIGSQALAIRDKELADQILSARAIGEDPRQLVMQRIALRAELNAARNAERLSKPQLPMAASGGYDVPAIQQGIAGRLQRSDAAMEQNYRGALETATDPQVKINSLDAIAKFAGRQGKMDPTGTEADFFGPGKADYSQEAAGKVPGAMQAEERRLALGQAYGDRASSLASIRTLAEKNRNDLAQAEVEAQKRELAQVGQESPDMIVARALAKKEENRINSGGFDAADAKKKKEDWNAALDTSGVSDAQIEGAGNAIKSITGQMSDLRSGYVTGPVLGSGNESWQQSMATLNSTLSNLEMAEQQSPGSARVAAQMLLDQLPPTSGGGQYEPGVSLMPDTSIGFGPVGMRSASMAKAVALTSLRNRLSRLAGVAR